jgi:hypothetical protein
LPGVLVASAVVAAAAADHNLPLLLLLLQVLPAAQLTTSLATAYTKHPSTTVRFPPALESSPQKIQTPGILRMPHQKCELKSALWAISASVTQQLAVQRATQLVRSARLARAHLQREQQRVTVRLHFALNAAVLALLQHLSFVSRLLSCILLLIVCP